ncbi:MAG: hypothetical protein V3R71_05575 [Gemmatimonadales bacterium]
MRSAVHYIPIATTVFALAFAIVVLRGWRREPDKLHLAWWGFGLLMYGLGTLTESLTTLFGWHEDVFRMWYISGALLGGAPLAQGTIYLLLRRRTANILTAVLVPVITTAAVCVLLSPINYAAVEPYRLSGAALEWQWVRLFSPFINLYAATFLIGGALVSAWRYRTQAAMRHRYLGNIAIAIGALLPGIGGTFTRFGYVEVLYVTEFLGLALIWLGYQTIVRGGQRAVPAPSLDRAPSPAPTPSA